MRLATYTSAFLCSILGASTTARADDWSDRPTAPVVRDVVDFTPRKQKWVEPKALNLPSDENLRTTTVRGKTYNIVRVAPQKKAADGEKPAIELFEALTDALYFRGSGGGGIKSAERLIVEDCTFVIDFQEGDFGTWDPKRSAIYVEGYKEVVIRNCVFISLGTDKDPMRRTIAGVYATDCVNVQVEDCYFEGRTIGWRGQLTIWGCGPTSIRNCEFNGNGRMAGGIWVGTGVGEGKIGWPHAENPELMIYPPGPLLIENCHVHDQRGKENSDGIYVQSVQPYLIRNCRVENWGPDDSLIDVGFRDTAGHTFAEKQLANHGGLGMIEHCELTKGWVKDSVGLAGGLIFRNNTLNNAWLFPYAFDGGSWYVVGNVFESTAKVVLSGRNGQLDGWTPKEGMFANGSKMYLFNNHIKSTKLSAVYVAGAAPGPVSGTVVSDYNVYDFATEPKSFAIESDKTGMSFEQWREKTGNDRNSMLGRGSLHAFGKVSADTVTLPGGVKMTFGPTKAGLVGKVGVSNASVLERAKPLSASAAATYEQRAGAGERQAEVAKEKAAAQKAAKAERDKLKIKTEFPSLVQVGKVKGHASDAKVKDASYKLFMPAGVGDAIRFQMDVKEAGTYEISTAFSSQADKAKLQLHVDGKPLGEPFDVGGEKVSGQIELSAGPHEFTYEVVALTKSEGTKIRLWRVDLLPASPAAKK